MDRRRCGGRDLRRACRFLSDLQPAEAKRSHSHIDDDCHAYHHKNGITNAHSFSNDDPVADTVPAHRTNLYSLAHEHTDTISRFMNTQLHDELLARMKKEQNLRQGLIDNPDDIQLLMRMLEADAQNTMWLDEIINQHGWLTNSLVGEDGAQAAWLFVQHSPAIQFQKKCLPLLESAVSQNEASRVNLA